jgi:hypothetical protein
MQVENPQLNFPATFCCNCGDINCQLENQDTRITRYFFLAGSQTTFNLSIPVCAACLKSTRRRPQGLFARLLVYGILLMVVLGGLLSLGEYMTLPLWATDHLFAIGAVIALVLLVLFYRLRRPKPPQTSFYQPVRIRAADVRFGGEQGQVAYMKLAFTNHEYLNVFATANRDAIKAKTLSAVKA